MSVRSRKLVSNPDTVVMNYLGLAHGDYLAARHLLREGFLEHGAMLSSTAAEKYLKAVIGVHGISNSDHLGGTLYKLVSRCQPDLFEALDKDFLKFLEKAYKLRYASASSPGLSIVLNQYRTLVAIDSFIANLDRGFKLRREGVEMPTPYRVSAADKDKRLAQDNIVHDVSLVPSLLTRANKVMELKIEDDFATIRVEYETQGVNMSGPWTKLPDLSMNKSSFVLTRG